MFIYSYQQHDHLLPGNDRMLVIGSSALAKNHGHLKSSRLAADTLIFNFPLNHPRLWRQMEHSLSGARYSIILFMWPPLHLSPANGRLMEKPPEGGGPMESAEDMLCRLFAFLRKQTRRLILLEEKEKIITAFNAIVRETASSLPGAVLSDHHDFMQGARYIDPFHFSPPDRAYQAGKTAGLLLPLLSARQEPPKEQECPKTRPEP